MAVTEPERGAGRRAFFWWRPKAPTSIWKKTLGKIYVSMVPGPGWVNSLLNFWAHLLGRLRTVARTIKKHFLDHAPRGDRKQFFDNFLVFLAVEPGALISMPFGCAWKQVLS